MKKLLLLAIIAFTTQFTFAQFEVGITGGYLNVTGEGDNEDESGFYGGLYTELSFSNSFKLQPELLYGHAGETNFFYLPVMLKYYVGGSDFNLQVGPQATYFFGDNIDGDFTDQLGLDLGVGVGYDILHNIFIEARYGFKIAEQSETFSSVADFNTLMIGLAIGL